MFFAEFVKSDCGQNPGNEIGSGRQSRTRPKRGMLGYDLSLLRITISRSVNLQRVAFKMGFGDLKSTAGLKALNSYLQDKSYIEG